mmetsp:Transcript_23048/g.66524  ORF Transcript_23048/g.66524 Transcript_23048/m.66524 type:complete len:212 (-) Transcript_23048:563-1198(-)
MPPSREDIVGHLEHHFRTSQDSLHISLMPQAPHGSAGGSDEARRHPLHKASLIPTGSTHPPKVRKSKDHLSSWLFECSDEHWRQSRHNFRFGGLFLRRCLSYAAAAKGKLGCTPSRRCRCAIGRSCASIKLGVKNGSASGNDGIVTFGHTLHTLEVVEGKTLQHQGGAQTWRHVIGEGRHAEGSGSLLHRLQSIFLLFVAQRGLARACLLN